jgi:Transthyretin-like family
MIFELILDSFSLYGKIISKDNAILQGMKIQAYDQDSVDPDDLLGQSTTDSNGIFRIDFDKSKFSKFWELLEGTPDVYLLIKDSQGNQVLQTRVMQTQKEIEYHIKTAGDGDIRDPDAKDIYAGNARRLIGMLRDVGNIMSKENQINLSMLQNGNLSEDIKKDIQKFVNDNEDRSDNFRQVMAVLASLSDTILEELHIENIGYDGPQVPRYPRREHYNKVIIWPRNEVFKWA